MLLLAPHEIHLWPITLALPPALEEKAVATLDAHEQQRAARFHFRHHQQRFIAAHYALRCILSLYLDLPPAAICYAYTAHQKPFLNVTTSVPLQFNISHSHEMAVFAISGDAAIGVDIEKIAETYYEAVAKRYFSATENQALDGLTGQEKIKSFYQLWARKEAFIKAVGQGLSLPLSSFTVNLQANKEMISWEQQRWLLLPLNIHPEYQAALACHPDNQTLCYWDFTVASGEFICTRKEVIEKI